LIDPFLHVKGPKLIDSDIWPSLDEFLKSIAMGFVVRMGSVLEHPVQELIDDESQRMGRDPLGLGFSHQLVKSALCLLLISTQVELNPVQQREPALPFLPIRRYGQASHGKTLQLVE
jgi:hypothetical protein